MYVNFNQIQLVMKFLKRVEAVSVSFYPERFILHRRKIIFIQWSWNNTNRMTLP